MIATTVYIVLVDVHCQHSGVGHIANRNGVCAQIHTQLDEMYRPVQIPSLRDIKEIAAKRGWNENNVQAEYYAWRRQHGITGRIEGQLGIR
jgi:hypothetical protein